MIRINGLIGFLLLGLILLSTSCRQEESLFVGDVPEDRLVANSNLTNLLSKVATKDGSDDDIIDGASCISIQLPVNVNVDGTEILVDGPEDYENLEILVDNDGDNLRDFLEIEYPITVIARDYTETIVASANELQLLADQCQADEDDDIECVDIVYPITVSFFDTLREQFDTVVMDSDMGLYRFVEALDDSSVATIDFPVSVLLSDETEVAAADMNGLENIIELAKDDCEEDDDIDFEDDDDYDDCERCDNEQFLELWAACSEWKAHKFELEGMSVRNLYLDLIFHFMQDGTVEASTLTNSFSGTWETSGVDGDATFTVNIPGLDDFNEVWNIKEIKIDGRPDVRLELGENELHFQWSCPEEYDQEDNDDEEDDDDDDD